jgi:predicted RNase H-like HicB family nuclease/predicted DNA binding CopG/RHH family protein
MPTYIATIDRKADRYVATIPDFPELEAIGSSLDEVRVQAQGTLEEHLATTFDASHTSTASTLDEIAAKIKSGTLLMALTVDAPKSRAVRINITIPEDLLQAVDRAAEAHSMSRSRFLARSVEAVVTGKRHNGVQIPLSSDVLEAVDRAAEAHSINRTVFLARLVELGLGMRKGHAPSEQGHEHRHHEDGCCHNKKHHD